MLVQVLPPIPLIERREYVYRLTLEDTSGNPVDFTEVIDGTGWTGRFTMAEDLDSAPVVDREPTLGADGSITVTITPADVASFTPSKTLIPRTICLFQIELYGPIAGTDHLFQGPVTLAGVI